MRWQHYLPLVAMAGLTACATTNPAGSWVAGIQPQDARTVSADATEYLATIWPAGRSVVSVAPSQGPEQGLIEPQLETDLRARGFGVAPTGQPAPGSHTLRYLISPSELGLSVRLYADATEATRLYGRTATGSLQAIGPFVVRQ